jgi:hypothetical protein
LRDGKIDVLTLSPLNLPDEGMENFASLALEHNPKIRVTAQESWLPFDAYNPANPLQARKVDHNAPTGASLRKLHEPYFKEMIAILQSSISAARWGCQCRPCSRETRMPTPKN